MTKPEKFPIILEAIFCGIPTLVITYSLWFFAILVALERGISAISGALCIGIVIMHYVAYNVLPSVLFPDIPNIHTINDYKSVYHWLLSFCKNKITVLHVYSAIRAALIIVPPLIICVIIDFLGHVLGYLLLAVIILLILYGIYLLLPSTHTGWIILLLVLILMTR